LNEVVLGFTGGKDSTYQALLLGQRFDRVHLLTFYHHRIRAVENACVNVEKLRLMCGQERYVHQNLPITDWIKRLAFSRDAEDRRRYSTWAPAFQLCASCRIAMAGRTVEYAVAHGIHAVRDGSNNTGFDLSQQPFALDLQRAFYGSFGIDYQWDIYGEHCDVKLLEAGLLHDPPVLFFRSQPECLGIGLIHNIFLRTYFLQVHGADLHATYGRQWYGDHLMECRQLLAEKGIHAIAAAAESWVGGAVT
jgi:hypothetical protein